MHRCASAGVCERPRPRPPATPAGAVSRSRKHHALRGQQRILCTRRHRQPLRAARAVHRVRGGREVHVRQRDVCMVCQYDHARRPRNRRSPVRDHQCRSPHQRCVAPWAPSPARRSRWKGCPHASVNPRVMMVHASHARRDALSLGCPLQPPAATVHAWVALQTARSSTSTPRPRR